MLIDIQHNRNTDRKRWNESCSSNGASGRGRCPVHPLPVASQTTSERHQQTWPHAVPGNETNAGHYPPPLAQARPRSQKSGQNGGSTPTPCLDKAVHARDTCDSQTGNNIVSRG